jgi:hypothetical protein
VINWPLVSYRNLPATVSPGFHENYSCDLAPKNISSSICNKWHHLFFFLMLQSSKPNHMLCLSPFMNKKTT